MASVRCVVLASHPRRCLQAQALPETRKIVSPILYLSGLSKEDAEATTGPARVLVLVDGVLHDPIIKTTLLTISSSSVRFYSFAVRQLAEGKLRQPWSVRRGRDGVLEVLFHLKVSEAEDTTGRQVGTVHAYLNVTPAL